MTATLGRFLILASVLVSTTGAMISFAAGAGLSGLPARKPELLSTNMCISTAECKRTWRTPVTLVSF